MTRISELPENQVDKALAELVEAFEAIKAYQRSGADSVQLLRVFTDDVADVVLTNVQFNDKAFYLVFTPDDNPFDAGLVYKMDYTDDQVGGVADILVERQAIEEGNVQKWLFALNGSDFFPVTSVSLKFYLWTTGPGTISIELL